MLSKNLIVTVWLIASTATAVADVEISEQQSGNMITETLKCESKNDLKNSRIPGFVEVLISSKMKGEVRYLPVDNIRRIDSNNDGVYIIWETERARDGQKFITTVIFMPAEIQTPEKVIEVLRNAAKLK